MAEFATRSALLTRELIVKFVQNPATVRALEALAQDLSINVPAIVEELETALSLIDGAPIAAPLQSASDLRRELSDLEPGGEMAQMRAELQALQRRVSDLESRP